MALVVFLRGVNVGGHRTFRPKQLAGQLQHLDAVNVGAAGTFVIREPIAPTKLRTVLQRLLPFDADIAICEARDIIRLIASEPFGTRPSKPGLVRFTSVLVKPTRMALSAPLRLPSTGQWLVRVLWSDKRFIVGEYRRQMETIRYLGQLDRLAGVAVTTRNWNTINQVAKFIIPGERLSIRR